MADLATLPQVLRICEIFPKPIPDSAYELTMYMKHWLQNKGCHITETWRGADNYGVLVVTPKSKRSQSTTGFDESIKSYAVALATAIFMVVSDEAEGVDTNRRGPVIQGSLGARR